MTIFFLFLVLFKIKKFTNPWRHSTLLHKTFSSLRKMFVRLYLLFLINLLCFFILFYSIFSLVFLATQFSLLFLSSYLILFLKKYIFSFDILFSFFIIFSLKVFLHSSSFSYCYSYCWLLLLLSLSLLRCAEDLLINHSLIFIFLTFENFLWFSLNIDSRNGKKKEEKKIIVAVNFMIVE